MTENINFVFSRDEDDAAIYAIRCALNCAIENKKDLLFFIRNSVESQRQRVHSALRLGDKVGNFDPAFRSDIERILRGIKFIQSSDRAVSSSTINELADDKGIKNLSNYVLIIDDESDERIPSTSTVFGLSLLKKRQKMNIYFHKTITENVTAHEVSHLRECALVNRIKGEDCGDVFSIKHLIF